MRGAGRPCAEATSDSTGAMRDPIAAAEAIQSTTPSANSPATRSIRGDKADNKTDTGCSNAHHPAGAVCRPVRPVEVDVHAVQQIADDAQILLGVAAGMVVRQPSTSRTTGS